MRIRRWGTVGRASDRSRVVVRLCSKWSLALGEPLPGDHFRKVARAGRSMAAKSHRVRSKSVKGALRDSPARHIRHRGSRAHNARAAFTSHRHQVPVIPSPVIVRQFHAHVGTRVADPMTE